MVNRLKVFIHKFYELIYPIRGIAYFLFLFLVFEFVWKLCVHESDNGQILLIFGKDLTTLAYPICLWTARTCYWVIHDLLGFENFNIDGLFIYFDNSLKMKIIWGCTGIKQMLQFTFIIVCFWGSWKRKLAFIPISVIVLGLVNILRLVVTAFVIKDGFPEWFIAFNESFNHMQWDNSEETYWKFYVDWYHFFHDSIFKWVYYDGFMFLLWLVWYEHYSKVKIK